MIVIDHVYILVGLMFAAFATLSLFDRANPKRVFNAAFWGLIAVSMLAGRFLGDLGNGLLVVALVAVGGFGLLGRGDPPTTTVEERRESAARRGNWLFVPALIIPATAVIGTLAYTDIDLSPYPGLGALQEAVLLPAGGALRMVIAEKQHTLISLALGCVIALAVAMAWLRPPVLAPLQEGRRLMDSIGWAAVLPQMLACLGAVFLAAKVGDVVGELVAGAVPLDSRFAAVAAYCVGMALFTIIMGNAFAAFPVMTAAIGLPFVIQKFGGDAAVVGAIGMLAGFCGTLMTPMAANFNVVPANLLELPDRNAPLNGVIRAQIPTALPLLVANILLMYFLAFR